MASAEFRRWTERFDQRHRYGIPALPTGRTIRPERTVTMPPTLVPLPPRSGSMQFSEEDLTAIRELLTQAGPGQAVRLTDDPDDSDNTARRRAEILKEQLGADPIKPGFKVRGHVLTDGEAKVTERTSEKSGKTYKITAYPKNWAAVSLVPVNEPDDSQATPGSPDEQPATENPVVTPDTTTQDPENESGDPVAENATDTPSTTPRTRRGA